MMIRTLLGAGAVCIASWMGLLVGAGDVGLQRSASIGPLALFEYPLAVALATGMAFVISVAATMLRGASRPAPLSPVAAVAVGDLMGGLTLAPLAVGYATKT